MISSDLFEYSNKFNIKDKFLKRIGIESSNEEPFKIETLEDLSNLQIQFHKNIPFDNTNIILNGYKENETMKLENIIKRTLDDGLGGYCSQLNILFGTFLTEMGFKLKLISGVKGSDQYQCQWFVLHVTNILEFNNKLYFIDVGFGSISPFKPIPIDDNNNNQIGYSSKYSSNQYRVIKLSSDNNDDDEYLYQEKLISDNEFKAVFHFNLKALTNDEIEFKSIKYSTRGTDAIVLISSFNNGDLILKKDKLLIIYNNKQDKCNGDNQKDIEINNEIDSLFLNEDLKNEDKTGVSVIPIQDCNKFNLICNKLFKYNESNNKNIKF